MEDARGHLEAATSHVPTSVEAMAALASLLETEGDLVQAEATYQRALGVSPGATTGYQELGHFYRRTERNPEALAVYLQAMSISPQEPDLCVDIGDLYFEMGELDEAMYWYDYATGLDSSDPGPYLAKAKLLDSQENWDQALDVLRTALSHDPHQDDVHLFLGNLYQKLARFNEARAHYGTACSLDRSQPDCLIAMARLAVHSGAWSTAISALEEAIRVAPTELEAYQALGEAAQIMGDRTLAADAFTRGIERSLDKQAAYLLRAGYYESEGMWERAQADLERARESDPSDQAAGLELARFFVRRGETKQALTVLGALLAQPNPSASIYRQLGDVYTALADWSAAEQAYHRAIQEDAESVFAYSGLARVYQLQGRTEEAMDLFQTAVEEAPADPQAHVLLGLALQARRDYPGASAAFERALVLDSWNTTSLISLDRLLRLRGAAGLDLTAFQDRVERAPTGERYLTVAFLEQNRGHWAEAEKWYLKAIDHDPYESDHWLALGFYQRSLGQWDQALDAFTNAVKYAPSSSSALLATGDAQKALGLVQAAAESFQQAIEAGPALIENYLALSDLHMEQGQSEDALNVLERGLARAAADPRSYQALGTFYVLMGDPQRADENYRTGLEVFPGAASLYVSLGDLSSGVVGEARTNLDVARATVLRVEFILEQIRTKEAPTRKQRRKIDFGIARATQSLEAAQSRYGAAQLAFQKVEVDLEAARSAYQKALDLDPGNELALIGLGRLSALSSSPVQALPYYQDCVAANPDSIQGLITLGNTYLDLRRPEDALPVFQAAHLHAPNDPNVEAGLSRSLRGLDERDMIQAAASVQFGQFEWDNLMNALRWQYR
jgi:tetratricopeptide (TPR) repeat protein